MAVTRCPQCTTAFKFASEHLAQAQGWVRCGRCQHVFEALRHEVRTPSEDPWQTVRAHMAVTPAAASPSVRTARPWMGPLVWMVNALLVFTLALQWVVWQREALAAQEPMLRPPLQSVCRLLGCTLEWPRRLDALVMTSSRFQQEEGGTFVLQVRVRNSLSYPLTTPALSLTLLDLQEQVVLRRVFQPSELGLEDTALALRELQGQLRFTLDPELALRVTGYRAEIFYL